MLGFRFSRIQGYGGSLNISALVLLFTDKER